MRLCNSAQSRHFGYILLLRVGAIESPLEGSPSKGSSVTGPSALSVNALSVFLSAALSLPVFESRIALLLRGMSVRYGFPHPPARRRGIRIAAFLKVDQSRVLLPGAGVPSLELTFPQREASSPCGTGFPLRQEHLYNWSSWNLSPAPVPMIHRGPGLSPASSRSSYYPRQPVAFPRRSRFK